MKKTLPILLGLLIYFAASLSLTAASDQAVDVLKKSDTAVFPNLPVKLLQRLEDYENQQFKRYCVFDVYSKGDNRYLIVGIEPALMKGIAQLRIDDAIFNYLKKVDMMQQVSAKINFGNSVMSEEDIVGGKLENYYNVDGMATVQEDGKEFIVLTLIAKSKDVAYKKIVNFLDPVTYFPVKRLYYAFSEKQVKEMIFEDIQLKDGKLSLMKFTMYDSLRKGWFTKATLSNFDYSQEIPDKIFTRMYMRAVTK